MGHGAEPAADDDLEAALPVLDPRHVAGVVELDQPAGFVLAPGECRLELAAEVLGVRMAQQELGRAAHYAYLGVYILGYIADDTLMVTMAVVALSSNKLTERAGRWLKFLSGAIMLVLGGIMLLRPGWLL